MKTLKINDQVRIEGEPDVFIIHHINPDSNQMLAHRKGTEIGEELSYRISGKRMRTIHRGNKRAFHI